MPDLSHVAVIGTGSWGTTLAVLLAQKGLPVALWARTRDQAERFQTVRENLDFVPGRHFSAELLITNAPDRALNCCTRLPMVVSAQTMREKLRRVQS